MSDDLSLGPCCMCERVGSEVRNLLMLDLRCLVPGHGWGCVVCDIPSEGASAVLCDRCLDAFRGGEKLRFACRGWPSEDGRAPIAEFREAFGHDWKAHHEDD